MDQSKSETKQSSFTCISCHVFFKNAELQREHYRSDWHRYNLKRKVSDLPPVSAEDFHQKIMNQRNIEELSKQDKHVYCDACRKSFANQNSYDNHLNSKKHKESLKNEGSEQNKEKETVESDVEEVDSDEWDEDAENPIDTNNCMFCLHQSNSFIKNLEHMTVAHSFFIPDIEYCSDVQGLLRYLTEKISVGFMCLWCNEKGKAFYSADAARKHMVDKGHCRMLHEGEVLIEYTDFYDYSSSYPDADKETDKEEEVDIPQLDDSEYQLVLPSGATIGHRSLLRYYKQSLNPNSALVPSNAKKVHKVLSCYRSLGWVGTNKEVAARKARDIFYMNKMQAKLRLQMGVKGNKLHKHVRAQVNF